MSKSAGNFYTLRDLLERGYSGREIRYALLSVHYRLPLNFTLAGLDAARAALGRLDAWVERLTALSAGATPTPVAVDPSAQKPAEDFLCSLDDDLNISGALGRLFDWLRDSNRAMDSGTLSPSEAAATLGDFERLNTILALAPERTAVPAEVLALVEERQAVRAAKDWSRSDQLRDAIAALGWTIKDTKQGPQVTRL
jgi:cysteinyl-tRNA synthetase